MEDFFAPVEVGSLSHYVQCFIHPNGGWEWDFLLPSTVPMPKILKKPPTHVELSFFTLMRPRSVVVVLSPELLKRMWCSLAKLLNGDRIARGKMVGTLVVLFTRLHSGHGCIVSKICIHYNIHIIIRISLSLYI